MRSEMLTFYFFRTPLVFQQSSVIEDKCKRSMVSYPSAGFYGSNHLGHLLHHFVHGIHGRLPDDDVQGLCRHDEAHCLMNR